MNSSNTHNPNGPTACAPLQNTLTAYLLGDLAEAEQIKIRAHVDTCESCRAAIAEIEPTLDLLRDLLVTPASQAPTLSAASRDRILLQAHSPDSASGRWFVQRHPWMTAAAAAALVGGFILFSISSMVAPRSMSARVASGLGEMQPQSQYGLFPAMTPDTDETVVEEFNGTSAGRGTGEPPVPEPPPPPGPNLSDYDHGNGNVTGFKAGRATSATVTRERRSSQGLSITTAFDGSKVNAPVDAEDGNRLLRGNQIAHNHKALALLGADKKALSGGLGGGGTAGKDDTAHYYADIPAGGKRAKAEASKLTDSGASTIPNFVGMPKKGRAKEENWKRAEAIAPAVDGSDVDGDGLANAFEAVQLGTGRSREALERNERDGREKALQKQNADDADKSDTGGDARFGTFLNAEAARADELKVTAALPGGERDASGAGVDRQSDTDAGEVGLRRGWELAASITELSETRDKDREALDPFAPTEPEMPAQFHASGVNPFVVTLEQPFSTFAIDVDTASYTVARNYMTRGYRPPAESVRTEEFVNFFDYAYRPPQRDTFKIYAELAPSKFGRGLNLLKIGVKGRRLGREEQRRAVLTFLVDASGSMDQPDRMGLVKRSLHMMVDALDAADRVAIVQYGSEARLLLEHTPAAEQAKIKAAIDGMQCSGSTNLEKGMRRAYRVAAQSFEGGAENRVLLLSDGVATLGSGTAVEILDDVSQYRRQGITCSVFGFGMGTYDDVMLETLANKGDGTYQFVDSEREARRIFVDDLSATLNTIATDVKIQVEFMADRVTRYRQLGYENRQLKKEDFRNDAVDAGEVGSGQSVTALYELDLVPAGPALAGRARSVPQALAMIRVRYRRVDTGEIEEIERAVTRADLAPSFDAAPLRFRLAACVAEFAEILRGSPFAAGSDGAGVADVLRPVALDLHLDERVQELVDLVQGADGLSVAGEDPF